MIAAARLILSSAYILAGLTTCPTQPAPEVTLDFRNVQPEYQNDKSSADLGRYKIDTKFSHGPDEVFSVGGLTESHIESGFELSYKSLSDPHSGQTCVWLDKISIKVKYAPVVHIASNFAPRSCRYDTTGQHELRHVNTDIITLNEYLPKLKTAAESVAQSLGVQGPTNDAGVEAARAMYLGVVRTEIEKQAQIMEGVRFLRQQQIDTRAEYLRMSALCPKEQGGRR